MYALPREQQLPLIQALVFAQVRADQQHARSPSRPWAHFQESALQSLEWATQRQSFLDKPGNADEPVDAIALLSAFAKQRLPAQQALVAGRLFEKVARLPGLPAVLTAKPAGTFSLVVASSTRQASVMTLACPAGESGSPPALQLSFSEYRIAAQFWQWNDQLHTSVGDYVNRHLKDLSDALTA
ncbi:hypothetical protein PMM47T1_01260 [Pseudomonas sp. M47T1]|nr:hypothetical protein PMM47T1_01260 [Pseudomonas sp. M47T1]